MMTTMTQPPTWTLPLSVAPMMQRTDKHYRYLLRRISARTLLYTEMITMRAILHGDRDHLLGYHADEHPLVLQVGGDDPHEAAQVARIAQQYHYDEINLNIGCPSERVQSGNFGACLMASPELVRDCVRAMREASDLPVTVKHRIGIDDHDSYEDMLRFVDTVHEREGCARFTVHARKAWLKGLSPRENREIPPLRYEEVYRLKRERPELVIELNGGVKTIEEARAHLEHVDAVMIGRAAYDDPMIFASADRDLFGATQAHVPTTHEVVEGMYDYIEAHMRAGGRLNQVTRHMLNLFTGQRGARAWRRTLSEGHHLEGAGVALVREALAKVPLEQPDAPQGAPYAAHID